MSENGFAEPVEVTENDLVGGEGDSAEPKAAFDRTPSKVLQSLAGKPLEQAYKAIEYINSGRERERRLLRLCSPQALNLIAANGPEYLTSVQAVQS